MALRVTDPNGARADRELSPRLADALRTGKGDWDNASAPVRRAWRRTLRYLRRNGLRIRCDCRPEGPEFVARRLGQRRYTTSNLPNADVQHAEDCVFRRGRVRAGAWMPGGNADLLNPFARHERREDAPDPDAAPRTYWRPPGVSTGERPKTMLHVARKLLQTARLNTLAMADRHPEPADWLERIAGAARTLYVPPRIPASRFLFTDPESWRSGAVGRYLDAAGSNWPQVERPFAFLCWPADRVEGSEVFWTKPEEGRIEASDRVVSPSIGRNPVQGPYLFLGAVARSEDGTRWECAKACAQPIAAQDCPVPVDSGYERGAVGALRALVRALRDSSELKKALGGAVRVALEKPLTAFEVAGGPCLPDFLLTVTRPGAYGHLPGGPGDPRHRGRYDPRDRARFIVEVMGFDDPQYEARKERTHARMTRIGPVLRMEGRVFGPDGGGAHRQARRIAEQIGMDLLRRWGAG